MEPDTLYHNIHNQIDLPAIHRWRFWSCSSLCLTAQVWTRSYNEVKKHDYPFPTLFIHGTRDDKAPYPIAEKIASNQTHADSDSWIVEDAHHELIFREHPREYLRKVSTFLGKLETPDES